MKNRLLLGPAALFALCVCASNAMAALTYFDAQIVDFRSGKSIFPTFPANTVMCHPGNMSSCDPVPFSTTSNPDPENTNGNNNGSNWTENMTSPTRGQDGLWNQRWSGGGTELQFGNLDPNGNDTVYESRGNPLGPNPENLPTLMTTIDVPAQDQDKFASVYVLFWDVGQPWQVSACAICYLGLGSNNDRFPLFVGHDVDSPSGYVFDVYDVGAVPTDATSPSIEMNGYTSTDAIADGTGFRLNAAWLGNVQLGSTLSVLVGDGPPLTPEQLMNNGGSSHRTWYDGIGYVVIPEPASMALWAMVLAGLAAIRRRS